ncbi:MAG: YvrJ family protein [Clostridium sp.]|uniref:YvrJ family protein n=1 Tax=Clostridium sp. TaxID=1506 RepID=UPI003F3136D1
MEGFMELIGNVGFPIGVSFYLLIRIESKMEVLITSINNLSNAVSRLEQNK